MSTTYTISLKFTDIEANNPLEATKIILDWIEDGGASQMIYDVLDESTNESFIVDLADGTIK